MDEIIIKPSLVEGIYNICSTEGSVVLSIDEHATINEILNYIKTEENENE